MIDWESVFFVIGMLLLGVCGVVGTRWAERPGRDFWKERRWEK